MTGQTDGRMATKMVQPKSVLHACMLVHGMHRGAIVAAHVAQMGIAQANLGHRPTAVEYAEFWSITERTAWNHRQAVRQVFGRDWQGVVDQVAERTGRKRLARRALTRLVAAL